MLYILVNRKVALAFIGPLTLVLVSIVIFLGSGSTDMITESSSEEPGKKISVKLTETFNEAKVWVPSTIYLKKGDYVQMTIINGDDDDSYRFVIPELDIESEDIPPLNGQTEMTFKADKIGKFHFTAEEVEDEEEFQVEEEISSISDGGIQIITGEIIIEE